MLLNIPIEIEAIVYGAIFDSENPKLITDSEFNTVLKSFKTGLNVDNPEQFQTPDECIPKVNIICNLIAGDTSVINKPTVMRANVDNLMKFNLSLLDENNIPSTINDWLKMLNKESVQVPIKIFI